MTKDPICGMTVDEVSTLSAERDGQTFYFCSDHCRQKFLSAPATAEPGTKSCACCQSPPPAPKHGDRSTPRTKSQYFCPMCPGVESDQPGDCPKCGMALERNPAWVAPATAKPMYTCPMHPEVQQDHPGDCPQCGMTLVLQTPTARPDQAENAELHDMTHRFWIGAALTLPVFVLAMAHIVPALARQPWVDSQASRWFQFALTTPVVGWAGWPFFRRGWQSVRMRHLNMFTLIGVGAAFVFSAVAWVCRV